MIRIIEHSKDLAVIDNDLVALRWTHAMDLYVGDTRAPLWEASAYPKVVLLRKISATWGKIPAPLLLSFLGRGKSNVGHVEYVYGPYTSNTLEVHFLRCRGAENLYRKLLRRSAEHEFPRATVQTQSAMADILHKVFKSLHNGGNTTTKLKPSEFKVYYDTCQHDCVKMFGVSGMDEDDGEFDHGFKKVQQ